MFRLSATLKRPVRPALLQSAIEAARDRFPLFWVRAKAGVFWHYLEENPAVPQVSDDLSPPCMRKPRFGSRNFLFQFRAYGHRVALEISHVLTDGTGALAFLQAVLIEYLIRRESLSRKTVEIQAQGLGVPVLGMAFSEAEGEYSYRRGYARHVPPPIKQGPSWHLPGPRLPRGRYHVTTAVYSLSEIREKARDLGYSVSDAVLGAVVHGLQKTFRSMPEKERRRKQNWAPIRVLVPVNLRPTFSSRTLRNFFVYVMVELDQRLGEYEYDEVVAKVHHQLRTELDPRSLRRHLTRNVRPERNPFIRVIPVFLKDVILKTVFRFQGDRLNTGSFSNLGRVKLPELVEPHVERFDFVPPPAPVTGTNTTLISYKDTLSLSFGSSLSSHQFERHVISTLHTLGLRGQLKTNWGWDP